MKKNIFRLLPSLAAVVAGNFLYAFTVKAFLMPAGLVTGGTTGIALTMEHLFQTPISLFVLLFNVAMLLIGWRMLGRAFALTTIGSTFLYPLALEVFSSASNSGIISATVTSLPTIFSLPFSCIVWISYDCDSGLQHHAHRIKQPLKKTMVRIPGPS